MKSLPAILLGLFLLATGGMKYLYVDHFQGAILAQAPVGLLLSGLLACLVPALELVLGAAVLLPATRRKAAGVGLALLLTFLLWKLGILASGYGGDCGCLGPFFRYPPTVTIWLDAAVILVAIITWRSARTKT